MSSTTELTTGELQAQSVTCQQCEQESTTVERRRQNTAYADEESNWVTVCEKCFEKIQENWEEMWEDYYAGRL